MIRSAFVVTAALAACHAKTPERALTCDLVKSAKLPTSVAAVRCVTPDQADTPLCMRPEDCSAIPACIRTHVAAHLGVTATWSSNDIDGIGSIRLFVGEPLTDNGYRTRMLEWTLISGYDPNTGEMGQTHSRVTECDCASATPPPAGAKPNGLGLGLDCECATPATLCSE